MIKNKSEGIVSLGARSLRLLLIRMFTNFGRDVVFSADLCYNGGSVKASLREGGGPR